MKKDIFKDPTPEDYHVQMKKNEQLFYSLLKSVRPDLYVLTDMIDKNNINPYIIFKILRQLLNIAGGTKFGRVIVTINNNVVVTVDGIDTDKVNDSVFKIRQ